MTIENFSYGLAHISNVVGDLHLEADVSINNGKATDINNGHVLRVAEDESTTIVADFHKLPGANHRTYFGEPTLDEQIELTTAIDTFCTDVTDKSYELSAQ